MAHTEVLSHKTQLNDRILWIDGESIISEQEMIRRLSQGLPTKGLYVDILTDTLKKYNRLVPTNEQIGTKKTLNSSLLTTVGEWTIPDEFKQLDIDQYIQDKLIQECTIRGWAHDTYLDQPAIKRFKRTSLEISLYRRHHLVDFLRALIYVINTLEQNKEVWGVGRGSSVSSYILYLIGVHDVDSVEYDLDITDFLH